MNKRNDDVRYTSQTTGNIYKKRPHEILQELGYSPAERHDFGDMARLVRVMQTRGVSSTGIADALYGKFGSPKPRIAMLSGCRPLNIFGKEPEPHVRHQISTALKLPVAVQGALMPDMHSGYSMPIGGVVDLDRAISPSFVGMDIACRMRLSVLDITPEEFMSRRTALARTLRRVTSFGVGADFATGQRKHDVIDDERWRGTQFLRNLRAIALNQLGSSGGGNHFADLLIGRICCRPADTPVRRPFGSPVPHNFVALMTHSGSRGPGAKTAQYYGKIADQQTRKVATGVPAGYGWLSIDSSAGQEYLTAMELMGAYAMANHELIHQHFVRDTGLGILATVENHHNFAWVLPDGRVRHRKGATPAETGRLGVLPGSQGTRSFVVMGLGNTEGLESAPHGSGRVSSRRDAHSNFNAADYEHRMAEKDILCFGVAEDESYQAYKDVETVIQYAMPLVEVVAEMEPKVVVMGGKSDDGD